MSVPLSDLKVGERGVIAKMNYKGELRSGAFGGPD